MINIQPSPDQLRELKAASADLPGPWISEIVLQTNQYDLMKLWYEAVLGGEWIAETNPNGPPPQEDRVGVGGKQVFASDIRASFMRLPMPHPYTMTFALFELTRLALSPDDDPGLNHMQLKFPDLDALIRRLEVLRNFSLHPHRGANHGATTSFYFRDPDENIVELCVDNFATVAEKVAFMQSPVFKANPSGISLDRDTFIAEHHAGVSA